MRSIYVKVWLPVHFFFGSNIRWKRWMFNHYFYWCFPSIVFFVFSHTSNGAEENKTRVSRNCSTNRSWIEELYICTRDETNLPVPSSILTDVGASCDEDADNLEQAAIDILQLRWECFSCHSSLRRRCLRLVMATDQANVWADVSLNVEKNTITENSNEHIQFGSYNDEDTFRVFADMDRGVYPDSAMRTVCEQLESRLQKLAGFMELTVNVYNACKYTSHSTSICRKSTRGRPYVVQSARGVCSTRHVVRPCRLSVRPPCL